MTASCTNKRADLMALRLWIFASTSSRSAAATPRWPWRLRARRLPLRAGHALRGGHGARDDSGGYKPVALCSRCIPTATSRSPSTWVPGQIGSSTPTRATATITKRRTPSKESVPQGLKYAHCRRDPGFQAAQGNAMLEWADSLYPRQRSPSIARARELHKGVPVALGETPPIQPTWPRNSRLLADLREGDQTRRSPTETRAPPGVFTNRGRAQLLRRDRRVVPCCDTALDG